MSFTLTIKEEARLEMIEAYCFYENLQDKLGDRFLSEVQKRLNDITIHPTFYSYIDERKILRDISLNVFPYVIVYRIINSEVRVYAILDTRKKPRDYSL